MSKHSVRQFTPARLVLSSAAAILAGLVGWVAIRAGGPANADEPVIVQPPATLQAVESPLPDSPSPSPSLAPSPSVSSRSVPPSASPSASRSPSRPAKPSRKPSPSRTSPSSSSPSPTPVNDLDATYTTTASWRDGLIGSVKIVNNGSVPREFTVTITYSSGADLRIRGEWNASADASGNRVTLRGGTLAPGASTTAGYQVVKDGDDRTRATGCTVSGGTCRVS